MPLPPHRTSHHSSDQPYPELLGYLHHPRYPHAMWSSIPSEVQANIAHTRPLPEYNEPVEFNDRLNSVNLDRLDTLIAVCGHLAFTGAVSSGPFAQVAQTDRYQASNSRSDTNENQSKTPLPSPGATGTKVEQAWNNNNKPVTFPGDPSHGSDMTVVDSSGNISRLWPKIETVITSDPLDSIRQFPLYSLSPRNTLAEDLIVQLRLVFSARALPRGPSFVSFMGSLQQRREVDTYLIPNEYERVHRDQDVVFGMTGALKASCQVLKELLLLDLRKPLSTAPYRIHLLVPTDADPSCFLPEPGSAWSAKHNMIAGTDESLLSIESTSILTLLEAVRMVGEALCGEDELFHSTFYQGGLPSIIPDMYTEIQEERLPSRRNSIESLPRPSRLPPSQAMTTREPDLELPFRLSLLLTTAQAHALREDDDEGVLIRLLLRTLGSRIRPSEDVWFMIDRDSFAVCEVGAHNISVLERSVMEVVRWSAGLFGTWMTKMLLPREALRRIHDQNQHEWQGRELRGCIASRSSSSPLHSPIQVPPSNETTTGCIIETLTRDPSRGIQRATQRILSLLFDDAQGDS